MDDPILDDEQRANWHEEGWCVLEHFLPADDVAAAQAELPDLYPTAEAFAAGLGAPGGNVHDASWDAKKPTFPLEGMALNHLIVHERLIALAEDLLGTDQLRLYQGHATAKYSDGDPEYEQLLHVDYGNHTLVVPRADVGYRHLELFVYLSDVTPELAATRMVSRRLTRDIPVERTYLSLDEYAPLYASEVPASGPSGSVLAYRPDVYHRGTSLTAKRKARFLLHVAYKPVATDWLGSQAWPSAAEDMAWHRFVPTASVRQLTVLGFPEPGHPYWNQETLDGVAARYPRLDMTPWRQATATAAGTTSATATATGTTATTTAGTTGRTTTVHATAGLAGGRGIS
ncbi:MAG: phytanoyl-CoA dioxygenase family protein [Acidimicrobiales bacterium]